MKINIKINKYINKIINEKTMINHDDFINLLNVK